MHLYLVLKPVRFNLCLFNLHLGDNNQLFPCIPAPTEQEGWVPTEGVHDAPACEKRNVLIGFGAYYMFKGNILLMTRCAERRSSN